MIFCNAWGSGREESAAAAGAVAAAAGVDGGGGPAGLELAVDQGDVAQPLSAAAAIAMTAAAGSQPKTVP